MRPLIVLALGATLALAACGGDDDGGDATTSTVAAAGEGSCSPVEEVDVGPVEHTTDELTVDDFATNPPSWGDHTDIALAPGQFYPDPVNYGHSVHLLEHGAVIGWTNGISGEETRAVEDAFNEAFQEGYYQLAVVENPDMEVPFALSAWGALQTCEEVDAAAIKPFIEEWYASPKSPEASLACQNEARALPPC
jgi:hypothetical protein